MNKHILPAHKFRMQALEWFKTKYARFCKANPLFLENAPTQNGMEQLAANVYRIQDNKNPGHYQTIDRNAHTCDCSQFAADMEQLGKARCCPHGIAVIVLLKAQVLEWSERENKRKAQAQYFECVARELWKIQDTAKLHQHAREIVAGFEYLDAQGQDVGVRGYIACLPARARFEYDIARIIAEV